MNRTRRIGAVLVLLMLVSTGLMIPYDADATTYSGNFVSGSKKVVLKDCNNVVSNNFVNGTLMIVLVGHTFTGCDVEVDVFGNRVGGNLEIGVNSNTVYHGNMRVKVHDNPQIGGALKVEVKSNRIHPKDPHLFLDLNLFVKIEQNGGNALDMKRNEVIAAGFQANIKSNWVKNSLFIDVKKNFVGSNYKLLVKSNIVNNIFANIEDNKACKDLTISFLSNTIDTRFKPLIQRNLATKDVLIQVNDNSIPYLDPRELDARIIDNHAATGKIWISVDSNNRAKIIKARVEKNGARGDGRFSFSWNQAIIQNEIHILDNRVDGRSTIVVLGNKPPPQPYEVKDNWACKARPTLRLQPKPTTAGNIISCTQQVPGDADNDGLTNDYEQMIGTDPNYWDTDYDGLFDGWGDYNKNGIVDKNEASGEIGHPLHPKGKTYVGAVDTLFNHPKEKPNCFCKDIYVEVDFMKKGPTIRPGKKGRSADDGKHGPQLGGTFSLVDKPHRLTLGQIKPLVLLFLKRGIRLHVDLGWPQGVARGDAPGGGEFLRHKSLLRFAYANDNTFDFYNFKNGEANRDYDGNGVRESRHFSTNRKGSFRYLIIGHNYSENPLSSGVAEGPGNDFFISHGNMLGQGWTGSAIGLGLGYTFCHELGHTMNLGMSPATHENAPWGYWSCMSYHASVAFTYIGYSDGVLGTYDDWPNMDVQIGIAKWWTHDYTK